MTQTRFGPALKGTCEVVELRNYVLRPGQRDTLISLFDTELVEPQERAGMLVLGQFRDLDDPQRFIWLRGFSDARTRPNALDSFYDGPTWTRHGPVANATMVSSDDVHLLRPSTVTSWWSSYHPSHRGSEETSGNGPGLVTLTVMPSPKLPTPQEEEGIVRDLTEAGWPVAGTFVTETGPDAYPRLPIRHDVSVLVLMAVFETETDHRQAQAKLAAGNRPSHGSGPASSTTLRLVPTARSLIRWKGDPH